MDKLEQPFEYQRKDNLSHEVLEAFKKVSPSAIAIEDLAEFERYITRTYNLFFHKLKFPPELFSAKRVLDFGCGTGEVDFVLANWGANVDGFDFNSDSITRANTLKSQVQVKGQLNFQQGDVHDFAFEKASYDRVISMGVIAHVKDQRLMFSRMVEACRPGGYLVLGYVDTAGLIQRLLHRAIVRANASENEEQVYKVAMELFGEHITRSVQNGGRTAESVINDYLVNPHYLGIELNDLMSWVEAEQLTLYSYWPSLEMSLAVDSPYKPSPECSTSLFKKWSAYLKLRWLYAQQEDETVFNSLMNKLPDLSVEVSELLDRANDFLQNEQYSESHVTAMKTVLGSIEEKMSKSLKTASDTVLADFKTLNAELLSVLDVVRKCASQQSVNISGVTDKLFRGYNGLGTNYVVLHKPQSH